MLAPVACEETMREGDLIVRVGFSGRVGGGGRVAGGARSTTYMASAVQGTSPPYQYLYCRYSLLLLIGSPRHPGTRRSRTGRRPRRRSKSLCPHRPPFAASGMPGGRAGGGGALLNPAAPPRRRSRIRRRWRTWRGRPEPTPSSTTDPPAGASPQPQGAAVGRPAWPAPATRRRGRPIMGTELYSHDGDDGDPVFMLANNAELLWMAMCVHMEFLCSSTHRDQS